MSVGEALAAARQALEDMAVEAYRAHRLTAAQLGKVLGIESRYDLDGFLKERGVWLEFTIEDFRNVYDFSRAFDASYRIEGRSSESRS